MKILLLDLDGTVRRPKSRAKFINNPDDQELIPGVMEAIARYSSYKIIGITNQGGVAAGYKTLQNCIEEQRKTLYLCNPVLWEIWFCPDNGKNVYCINIGTIYKNHDIFPDYGQHIWEAIDGKLRKPEPGMLLGAMFMNNAKPEECLMVGDRDEDQQAAQAAGVQFMWAKDWLNLVEQ